jgi:ParB family transcriptional regulator, chromosome partitioning protein
VKKENNKPKANKNQSLGRGLSKLLKDERKPDDDEYSEFQVETIEIKNIVINPYLPRTRFNEDTLNELARSINSLGLIQPIIVRKKEQGRYELVSGERRYRAFKILGRQKIPAFIRSVSDQEQLEIALSGVIQREYLDPFEIATTYQRMLENYALSPVEIAERVGKDRSTVTNYLRLLKLDPLIQSGVRDNIISLGHARSLCNIESLEDQRAIYEDILNKKLTVRQTERRVVALSEGSGGIAETLNRFDRIEQLSGLKLDEALADKLNSLKFCNSASSKPLKELSSNEIKSLNLGSQVRFSDFNEKTLSKLITGEEAVILKLECSTLSYVPGSSHRPLTKENIHEFILGTNRTGLGELFDPTIVTFGKDISIEDISELGVESVGIGIYQNITGFIVKVIERWIEDRKWREYHSEESSVDACLSVHTSEWGPSCVTNEVLGDEMGAYCHIENGGIEEDNFGVHSLGYGFHSSQFGTGSKELKFAITSTYNMNDNDWSGTFYFANPENWPSYLTRERSK